MPEKLKSPSTFPLRLRRLLLLLLLRLRQLRFEPFLWKSDHSLLHPMRDLVVERTDAVVSKLRSLRWVTVFLAIGNFGLIFLGGYLMASVLFGCSGEVKLPFAFVSLIAGVRLLCIVGAGFAQVATAATIVNYPTESSVAVDAVIRHERRMRYKRWLWWTRFGMGVTILQFVGALYLLYDTVKNFSYDGKSRECFLGWDVESRGRKQISVIVFVILAWIVVIIQCFTGSDVLRWRSFYATHDTAWKAHYLEVFDHGIREALCCLGRVKYLSVLEEDEVYSVARLLGDLVAYRASGTGHLEFLAGLALLQRHRESPDFCGELIEAPESRIREAASFHPFAEAAYTGPLLDFGRNPVLFPCAWVYRQGILTPWTRNRRPVLEGDNWWRGHAAAFLKYVNLPPDALRKGRVSQTKREAAYFIVVLHQLKAVVIAVRGTETPEDLLTDGLCRECPLTEDDLDGLINSGHLDPGVRERVLSTFPHYGHSGIVESARELFMQIDGLPNDNDGSHSGTTGFLSSLVGAGQECYGYRVCVVGHSLGGSVATLLGIRLYRRYPNLHVYSFGTLPCVDSVVAEACSDFVTSIVYNDEFSARLSVNSIIRLRAAAITALSNDSSADSAMICKLARRILHANKHPESDGNHEGISPSLDSTTLNLENSNHVHKRNCTYSVKGGAFLCAHAVSCMVNMPTKNPCSPPSKDGCDFSSGIMLEGNDISDTKGSKLAAGSGGPVQEFHSQEGCSLTENLNFDIRRNGCNDFNYRDALVDNVYDTRSSGMKCFEGSEDLLSFEDHTSRFMESMSMSVEISTGDPPEMYLPGLIIHIIPEQRSLLPLWKNWRFHDRKYGYRAFVARRENFKDIIVTPYMFLDHLPWRCHYAMQRVLETWKADGQLATHDLLNGEHAV